jgi:hypothetical protein
MFARAAFSLERAKTSTHIFEPSSPALLTLWLVSTSDGHASFHVQMPWCSDSTKRRAVRVDEKLSASGALGAGSRAISRAGASSISAQRTRSAAKTFLTSSTKKRALATGTASSNVQELGDCVVGVAAGEAREAVLDARESRLVLVDQARRPLESVRAADVDV